MPKEKQSLTSAPPQFLLENQRNVYSFTFCYRWELTLVDTQPHTYTIHTYCLLSSATNTTCWQICQDFSSETCMFYCESFWHADKSFFFFASYRPGRWSSSRMLRKVLWLYATLSVPNGRCGEQSCCVCII